MNARKVPILVSWLQEEGILTQAAIQIGLAVIPGLRGGGTISPPFRSRHEARTGETGENANRPEGVH